MDEQPRTTLQPRSRWPFVVIALAALAAVGYLVWTPLLREKPAPPPALPETVQAPVAQPEGAAPPVDAPTTARLLGDVSSHDLYRRALAQGDFVERAAVVVDNLAEGASPRRPLAFLAPSRPFTVVVGSPGTELEFAL